MDIAVQETMSEKNRAVGHRIYSCYSRSDFMDKSGGGSALLIRNDIAHVPIVLNTSLETVMDQIDFCLYKDIPVH